MKKEKQQPIAVLPNGQKIFAYNEKNQPVCGANRSNGEGICKCPAIFGNGRCRFHGGESLSGVFHPGFKQGRYLSSVPKRYRKMYQEFLEDKTPLSLMPDLALTVARVDELIKKLDDTIDITSLSNLKKVGNRCKELLVTPPLDMAKEVKQWRLIAYEIADIADMGMRDHLTHQQIQETQKHLVLLATEERKQREANTYQMAIEDVFALMTKIMEVIKLHVSDAQCRKRLAVEVREIYRASALPIPGTYSSEDEEIIDAEIIDET